MFFILAGGLDYQSAPALRGQVRVAKASQASAFVLGAAQWRNPAASGCPLLAFIRDASAQGKTLTVRSLPKDMHVRKLPVFRVCWTFCRCNLEQLSPWLRSVGRNAGFAGGGLLYDADPRASARLSLIYALIEVEHAGRRS